MNELLNQMTADATGKPVVAGPVEATAVGNLAVQFISLGVLSNLSEARAAIRRSFNLRTFEPARTDAWDCEYERWLKLRNNLG